MILLDTHAAVWIVTESKDLGQHSRLLVGQALAQGQLAISAISFWEIALLCAKKRFDPQRSPVELRTELLAAGVVELPLTGDIGLLAVGLVNLHADPADRFIVATAIVHEAMLMTADKALLRWRHPLKRQDATK